MWDFYQVSNPIARKDYECGATYWIDSTLGWDEKEYDEEDRPTIRKAIAEGKKILKGTQYVKVTGKWEGEFDTYRARKDLDDICRKYDLYDE